MEQDHINFLMQLPTAITIEGNFFSNTVDVNGKRLQITPSLKVRNHSPTGFNWGYGGSGPAQFALALLMKFVPSNTAQQYYQAFKFGFIAGLPRTDFIKTINLRQIMQDIIEKKETA